MGFLAMLKGFNWIRVGLVLLLAGAIFQLGSYRANVKCAERVGEVQQQITAAIVAKEAELRVAFAARLAEEEAARLSLQDSLTEIREHRDNLLAEIEAAELTKPAAAVVVEGCMQTDGESDVQIIGNPFSSEFVRLWNDASRGRLPGADPSP